MEELVNELAWSFGRADTFRECRRKYYWRYYGCWGGWDKGADRTRRLAYLLGKMTSTDMLAGSVAHEMIADSIKRLCRGGRPKFEDVEMCTENKLRFGFRQSREKKWRWNPKKAVNLFEDYYGDGVSEERQAEVIDKAKSAVANFFQSSCFTKLSDPRANIEWLAIDNDKSFSYFFLGDIKVFAEPDLAVRIRGNCYLFDWKTGKRADRDELQLTCYALYACSAWEAVPKSIAVRAVYLNEVGADGRPVEVVMPYDESRAEAVREYIRSSFSEMAALVTADNVARIDDFPKCDNSSVCRRCQFQELCA